MKRMRWLILQPLFQCREEQLMRKVQLSPILYVTGIMIYQMLNRTKLELSSFRIGRKFRKIFAVATTTRGRLRQNADYCRLRSGNLSASGGITMSTVRTCLVRWV